MQEERQRQQRQKEREMVNFATDKRGKRTEREIERKSAGREKE